MESRSLTRICCWLNHVAKREYVMANIPVRGEIRRAKLADKDWLLVKPSCVTRIRLDKHSLPR